MVAVLPFTSEVLRSRGLGDLRALAQEAFGKPFLKLVNAEGPADSGATMTPLQSLEAAGLQDGDQLSAVVAASNPGCGGDSSVDDGSVVGWGDIVVTAPQSKISCGVCNRFRLQGRHLLRYWKTSLL